MKEIDTRVAEAIFGGPALPVEMAQAFVRAHALPLPAEVVALPEGAAAPEAGAVPLRLHDGLVYWFVPVEMAGGSPRPPWGCDGAGRLVGAVQQAILRLRRSELRLLGQKSAVLTLQEEVEAFHHAVREVRRVGGNAKEALEAWGGIILHRYQHQINLIRLRLLELLTALTRGVEGRFAYVSYSLVKRIYAAQQLQELGRLPLTIARELGPLVIGLPPGGGVGEPLLSPVVRRALEQIAAVFREPASLSEIARACHVTPSHLARLFRKETGQSVVAHLQRLRINHARELLATTDRGLLEIALESGFESIEHFHRLFRRMTGVTPRAYRLAAK
ncbi:MAG TPA: helix-turn-helix transcriptional regulator [Chthoniobacteraceae bacterium]|nr:helix-turn-helix transcriptional regulator [Chthoniobacteraceae bacterium]